jgi:uncharacterized protein (DUF433 family)
MDEVAREVRKAASALRERAASDVGKVVQHRYLVHNAPVLAGTRIPTTAVWNLHEADYSVEAITKEFPRLTADDVKAAIRFEKRRRRERLAG